MKLYWMPNVSSKPRPCLILLGGPCLQDLMNSVTNFLILSLFFCGLSMGNSSHVLLDCFIGRETQRLVPYVVIWDLGLTCFNFADRKSVV